VLENSKRAVERYISVRVGANLKFNSSQLTNLEELSLRGLPKRGTSIYNLN